MFNYHSPTCSTNTDGFTTQTISGCTIRANDSPSDFFLVELSSIPPPSYNVFYAGWSNINTAPTSATGIHHPRGDVEKISHDTDPLVEAGYYTTGSNHWQVLDWNEPAINFYEKYNSTIEKEWFNGKILSKDFEGILELLK